MCDLLQSELASFGLTHPIVIRLQRYAQEAADLHLVVNDEKRG